MNLHNVLLIIEFFSGGCGLEVRGGVMMADFFSGERFVGNFVLFKKLCK